MRRGKRDNRPRFRVHALDTRSEPEHSDQEHGNRQAGGHGGFRTATVTMSPRSGASLSASRASRPRVRRHRALQRGIIAHAIRDALPRPSHGVRCMRSPRAPAWPFRRPTLPRRHSVLPQHPWWQVPPRRRGRRPVCIWRGDRVVLVGSPPTGAATDIRVGFERWRRLRRRGQRHDVANITRAGGLASGHLRRVGSRACWGMSPSEIFRICDRWPLVAVCRRRVGPRTVGLPHRSADRWARTDDKEDERASTRRFSVESARRASRGHPSRSHRRR